MQACPHAGAAARPVDPEVLRIARHAFQCARAGDSAALAPLLAAGLPPNLRNENGDTLLMLAAYHGHEPAVAALLAAGADPLLRNDRGQAPLDGAAFRGHLGVARALLAHGAPVDAQGPDGRSALMTAAMFDRTDMLALLLAHGADPQLRDAAGLRARDLALRMGADGAAERLAAAPRAAAGSS